MVVNTQSNHPELLSNNQDTIIALCTPRGQGAIALIRLTGTNVFAIADQLAHLSSKKQVSQCPSHTINHGYVINHEKNIIDEVLFLIMHGPKTFTGQDTVEISSHNNPFIIEQIVACAVHYGARHAKPGEFAKRAFLNGKIDLTQAEAINDVIHAPSEFALQKAQAQLKGSLSYHFDQIEQAIIELLSLVESTFEFLEEEQRDLSFDNLIKEKTESLLHHIKTLTASYSQQQQIKEGIKIAIIGSVNAGKSTLFNALIKKERAIVSNIAGTTRDSIEASTYHHGQFWTFIDTAGLRQTGDIIEQQGIARSYQEAEKADIILLVYDISRIPLEQELLVYDTILQKHTSKTIVIANKCDQQLADHPLESKTTLFVSAQEHNGIENIEEVLTKKINELFKNLNSPYLLNQRQLTTITEIATNLKFIANSYSKSIEYEVVAYHLRDILEKLAELTGKAITENILDTVFSKFCIGK